ncbi:MAG: mannitol dehydrogenase family protein [Alphaproteobacteria bacterium]
MLNLCEKTLPQIEGVEKPTYNRAEIKAGIIHFGVGGFHRAHQAVYMDDLLNMGETEWGICGIGVMGADKKMHQILQSQDYLYSLTIKHPDGHYDTRVIGSIIDYLYAPDNPEAVISKIAHKDTKIISLTITEGGYNFNQITEEFDLKNPSIIHDLHSDTPKTVFGLIIKGLEERKKIGLAAITIQSCDNIQGNGDMSKKMFTAFAAAKNPELATWIKENVYFPNSMVDRITPVTTKSDIEWLEENRGYSDGWPVVTEDFSQWVVEDHFCHGRPPYEKLPIEVVDDVLPYELMKLRLLNASHQALAYFGYLSGYRYAHEVCHDEYFVRFLQNFMHIESEPTLLSLPDVDLALYQKTLIERFANPEIADHLARLCLEGSDRIPKWLVPITWEQLQKNDPQIKRCAAVIASWTRYMEGIDEKGEPIDINDRLKERLMELASQTRTNNDIFISQEDLFGKLVYNELFMQHYRTALNKIYEQGAYATMKEYI